MTASPTGPAPPATKVRRPKRAKPKPTKVEADETPFPWEHRGTECVALVYLEKEGFKHSPTEALEGLRQACPEIIADCRRAIGRDLTVDDVAAKIARIRRFKKPPDPVS
jgi:hypothetical protein